MRARWVLLAVAFRTNPNASVFLLSVSATANPLGAWRNYALDATKDGTTPTGNWADFPALGVDASALYLTANMFAFGGGFQYAKIRVVPKAGPYSGGAGAVLRFREDEERGQQHGVHHPALPHLRRAAGRIPGELALSVRERADAVADRESDRGAHA